MSKKSYQYDLIGTPSTSGSAPSSATWNSSDSDVDNSRLDQHSNRNNEASAQEYLPNLVIAHPIMSLQSIATNFYNLSVCQENLFYMGDYFSQNFNRQYCQINRDEHMNRNIGRHGSTSNKQSILLLLIILFLSISISSSAMGNSCEDNDNDGRLLSARRWENVTSEKLSSRPGFIFSLMCYNVLSQDLLVQHPYLYNRHNTESLQWTVRWNNIFNEITKFKPDILCLQEVQESHIDNFFSLLKSIGYCSLYKRRTGERTDGCALFYKADLIQLVEHTSVEYFQPNVTVLNRDNVGLIAKFAPKLHPTREFVVATTHLLYNPRRQDVKLAQMQLLLTEIERLSYKKKSQEGDYVPIILTGDLNSTPDSPIYEFITKGELKYENLSPRSLKKDTNVFTGKLLIPPELRITDNCQHADLLEKRSKNEIFSRSEEASLIRLFHSKRGNYTEDKTEVDAMLFSTGKLSHNFAFKSVYSDGNPEYNLGTTFQEQWLTVDYIFYSTKKNDANKEGKLKLLSRYRLPTKEELPGINIPNSVVGSDHLSLLAKFKLEY